MGGINVTSPSSHSPALCFPAETVQQFAVWTCKCASDDQKSHFSSNWIFTRKMYPRKITRNLVPLKNFTHSQHPPPQLSWVLNIKVRSCWLWYRSSNSLPEVFPFLALLPFNSEWFDFFFFNSVVFAYFQHLPHVAWCQTSSKQASRNACSHYLQH